MGEMCAEAPAQLKDRDLAMFTAMRRAYAIRNFFDTCARV
jgi:hypothetical protein